MEIAVSHGTARAAVARPQPGAHVARAAAFTCMSQAEAGHGCPISMTYSAMPALRKQPELAERLGAALHLALLRPAAWSRRAEERRPLRHGDDREAGRLRCPRQHDPSRSAQRRRTRRRVRAHRPQVVLLGTDVRRLPRPRPDRARPLVLPDAPVPARRRRATASTSSGSRTSSATAPTPPARSSSDAAWAQMVGEEGRGVPTIIEMVNHTRLDCIDRLDGRHAARARPGDLHHTSHRSAFGKRLIDQPLMQNVLADLAVESEAATISLDAAGAASRRGPRRGRALGDVPPARDRRSSNTGSASAPRLTSPKRSSASAATATSRSRGMPRLYRESPLLSIWEGSGNVHAPRRAARDGQEPGVGRGLLRPRSAPLPAPTRGSTPTPPRPGPSWTTSSGSSRGPAGSSAGWRCSLQGSLLLRYGDPAVADAFCASRLGGDWGERLRDPSPRHRLRPHRRAPHARSLSNPDPDDRGPCPPRVLRSSTGLARPRTAGLARVRRLLRRSRCRCRGCDRSRTGSPAPAAADAHRARRSPRSRS